MGAYRRWQMLLRREDGAPGGFIRVEIAGEKATVEVRASGVGAGASARLFGKDGAEPYELGGAPKGAATFHARADAVANQTWAAIFENGKPVLVGGEGASFASARPKVKQPPPDAKPVLQKPAERPKQAEPPVGWQITRVSAAGLPERIAGQYLADGRVTAVLHGVAGAYGPEPPAGLEGFAWQGGYWTKVTAV